MAKPGADDADRRPLREAFVDDLYRLMEQRKISQRQLSLDLDLASHTVFNRWRHLASEPTPEQVFRIEEYLRVPPGSLSRRLGYLPLTAVKVQPTVDLGAAIDGDAVLPDWGKQILRTAHQEIMGSLGRGRRR